MGWSEGFKLSRLWKNSRSDVVMLRPGVIGPGSITLVLCVIFFEGWGFLNNCFGIWPKLFMNPIVAFFLSGSSILWMSNIITRFRGTRIFCFLRRLSLTCKYRRCLRKTDDEKRSRRPLLQNHFVYNRIWDRSNDANVAIQNRTRGQVCARV